MACLHSSTVVRTKKRKCGEMELFPQLLLESRIGAYIERLVNELIMNANI